MLAVYTILSWLERKQINLSETTCCKIITKENLLFAIYLVKQEMID